MITGKFKIIYLTVQLPKKGYKLPYLCTSIPHRPNTKKKTPQKNKKQNNEICFDPCMNVKNNLWIYQEDRSFIKNVNFRNFRNVNKWEPIVARIFLFWKFSKIKFINFNLSFLAFGFWSFLLVFCCCFFLSFFSLLFVI